MQETQRATRAIPAAYNYEYLPTIVKAQAQAVGGTGKGGKLGPARVELDATAEIEVGGDEVRLSLLRKATDEFEGGGTITLRRADLPAVLALFAKVGAEAETAARTAAR